MSVVTIVTAVTDESDVDGRVEVIQEGQVAREEGRVHRLLQVAKLKAQLIQAISTPYNKALNTVTCMVIM